jgi:hypothetical protein
MLSVEISLLLPSLHHAQPLPAHQEAPEDDIIAARGRCKITNFMRNKKLFSELFAKIRNNAYLCNVKGGTK